MTNYTKQELKQELSGDYIIRDMSYDDAVGTADLIMITKDSKKILLLFKEKNQTPAMYVDVKKMEKLKEKMQNENNACMIFCEKDNNPFAQQASATAGIGYYKRSESLIENIANYLA